MAMTERRPDRPGGALPAPTPGGGAPPRGFRPASRRRARIAAGAALAAVGIGGNVLLYTSLDDTTEVLQLTANVRAGQRIEATDLRVVEVELDATVPVVTADQVGGIVGQYASVYIAAGTLMVDVLVQPDPLVTAGQGVVAVEIRPTLVPDGVLERSRVEIVVTDDNQEPVFITEGRVVSVVAADADASDIGSMSVEVNQADAPRIAASDRVRIVLIDPGVDPALPAAGPPADTAVPARPAATTPPAETEDAPQTTSPGTTPSTAPGASTP